MIAVHEGALDGATFVPEFDEPVAGTNLLEMQAARDGLAVLLVPAHVPDRRHSPEVDVGAKQFCPARCSTLGQQLGARVHTGRAVEPQPQRLSRFGDLHPEQRRRCDVGGRCPTVVLRDDHRIVAQRDHQKLPPDPRVGPPPPEHGDDGHPLRRIKAAEGVVLTPQGRGRDIRQRVLVGIALHDRAPIRRTRWRRDPRAEQPRTSPWWAATRARVRPW